MKIFSFRMMITGIALMFSFIETGGAAETVLFGLNVPLSGAYDKQGDRIAYTNKNGNQEDLESE